MINIYQIIGTVVVICRIWQVSSVDNLECGIFRLEDSQSLTSRVHRLVITQPISLQYRPLQRLPRIRAMRSMVLARCVHPLIGSSLQFLHCDFSRSVAIVEEFEVIVSIVSAA
jgi:hypothetical protein